MAATNPNSTFAFTRLEVDVGYWKCKYNAERTLHDRLDTENASPEEDQIMVKCTENLVTIHGLV